MIKRIFQLYHKKLYSFLCFSMLLVSFSVVKAFAQDSDTRKVLILNSYQTGLSWTDHEVEGMIGVLNKSDLQITISVENMDWKNYPTSENLDNMYSSLRHKYSKKHLDTVITTDDAALEFALKNRNRLFPDAPIVFCGVNETGVRKFLKDTSNVTGVVEKIDPDKTIKAALKINPNLKKMYVIYDDTESGISTGEITIRAINRLAPDIKVIPLNQDRYSDLLNQVEQIQKDSAILITTYYGVENGVAISFEEFSEMISKRSQVPVYHLYEFGLDHGAVGGSMLYGKLQGISAAKLALKILHGTNIKELPIDRRKTTQYAFDYKQLQRFDISLNQLPKNCTVIHKPFSFIETYKTLVIMTVIIFLFMAAFIFVLIKYLIRTARMKQKLQDSNLELVKLYDDLAASDEELKQQFDELSITQKNLLIIEERYAQLFEKMMNGFIVVEPILDQNNCLIDLRFFAVNPSFEYHTKKQVSSITGKTWTEVFGYQNQDLDKMQEILLTGAAQRFETHYEEDAYYLVNAFRIENNQVGVVIENITDYKRAIEEVGKLNEELEQRVIDRTCDLQNAIGELEAFAYTVSHDLKSPLRAVDGYSKIILEDYQNDMNPDAVSMISTIRGICTEMIAMINKLLQYSTTARMSLHTEPVDMNELFKTTFLELRTTFPDRNIELIIETGLPAVTADRVLLRQAVHNILSNAMKFTKEREIARITVGATITENEYAFYVKDNGVGFDMTYSQKLFNIFQRLHTSDEFEGSGIGLVTIKKIFEKHGGRTWIEGKINSGATLFFTLPIYWEYEVNDRSEPDV